MRRTSDRAAPAPRRPQRPAGAPARGDAAAGHPRRRRDERGETLPLLIIWPTLLVAIMLLALHAFIVSNAQAEASLAASVGLRAAWRAAAESDLGTLPDIGGTAGAGPPGEALRMSTAAAAAVAGSAADDAQAWRWWSNQVVEVQSDWCAGAGDSVTRPGRGESGWVRVTVSGEVLGPLAALWPDRFDRVHAVAEGPARFLSTPGEEIDAQRAALPVCP